jgi:hypothetical protein
MPKPKLPAHLPQAWKYGNRFLEPGLTPALRRLYKDKIVLPEPEPLWSKSLKYGTYLAGGGLPTPPFPRPLANLCSILWICVLYHGSWPRWIQRSHNQGPIPLPRIRELTSV